MYAKWISQDTNPQRATASPIGKMPSVQAGM